MPIRPCYKGNYHLQQGEQKINPYFGKMGRNLWRPHVLERSDPGTLEARLQIPGLLLNASPSIVKDGTIAEQLAVCGTVLGDHMTQGSPAQ